MSTSSLDWFSSKTPLTQPEIEKISTQGNAATSYQRYSAAASDIAGSIIGRYSSSFSLSSGLLDKNVREDIASIYALVRIADEIVDGAIEDPQLRSKYLRILWDDCLDALDSGFSANLVVHAFASVCTRLEISPDLIDAFFESMQMDIAVFNHDQDSIAKYIYGSAEVIGIMCVHAFYRANPETVLTPSECSTVIRGARALGAAFQKVNFLRDVHDDAVVLGRNYMPGRNPIMLTRNDIDELTDDIAEDLRHARNAVALLPKRAQVAVMAAHDLFGQLNDDLRASNSQVISHSRVRISTPRKLALVVKSTASVLRAR